MKEREYKQIGWVVKIYEPNCKMTERWKPLIYTVSRNERSAISIFNQDLLYDTARFGELRKRGYARCVPVYEESP